MRCAAARVGFSRAWFLAWGLQVLGMFALEASWFRVEGGSFRFGVRGFKELKEDSVLLVSPNNTTRNQFRQISTQMQLEGNSSGP